MIRVVDRSQWRRFIDHPVVEWTIFVFGIVLIIAGILIAPLPGPGGIFLIAPGLALVLKTSLWAKKRYVHFKKWEPNVPYVRFQRWRPTITKRRVAPGSWTDWALRRGSAKRRLEIQKERDAEAVAPAETENDAQAGPGGN
jgi:hypothetical protein